MTEQPARKHEAVERPGARRLLRRIARRLDRAALPAAVALVIELRRPDDAERAHAVRDGRLHKLDRRQRRLLTLPPRPGHVVKRTPPIAALSPLELLAVPIRPTRVLFRAAASPLGRVEICGCRRDVVVLEAAYPDAVCHRCERRKR